MAERLLDKIKSPYDLRQLDSGQLEQLASEIRREIVEVTSTNGGHLAPNLGVVELTIGVHLALESPRDKIVWDVGHQCYVHKLLTGRGAQFPTLRRHQGVCGFPKRAESPHDVFDSGHASNSLSVALGLAIGRDRIGGDETVLAVIGDGSLTGGMAYEALNQAGHLRPNLIVILNDNEMSIDGNVGAMSSYLNRIRLDPTYNRWRDEIEEALRRIPAVGEWMVHVGETVRTSLKQCLVPGMLFEELGFKYIGPIDGHDIQAVKSSVIRAKQVGGPILIHALTQKGRGYLPAEQNPDRFHGTSPFVISTGEPVKVGKQPPTYTEVLGKTLTKLAQRNDRLVAVTAAMTQGTGLDQFAAAFPDRFFDVGIAEQHAVTFAAGMALAGWRPVVAIYSTFLQRAYDQVVQDVCLQELPVILAIDRAGLVGDDGPTHHGAFDLSYLSHIPGLTLMAPKDENEFQNMLYTATTLERPVAIRYPRGAAVGVRMSRTFEALPLGKAEVLESGSGLCIMAVGRMTKTATELAARLREHDIYPTVINGRFIKPIDIKLIQSLPVSHRLLITLEDNALLGGFGATVSQLLARSPGIQVVNFGLPDLFVSHGQNDLLFAEVGLNLQTLEEKVLESWRALDLSGQEQTRQAYR